MLKTKKYQRLGVALMVGIAAFAIMEHLFGEMETLPTQEEALFFVLFAVAAIAVIAFGIMLLDAFVLFGVHAAYIYLGLFALRLVPNPYPVLTSAVVAFALLFYLDREKSRLIEQAK